MEKSEYINPVGFSEMYEWSEIPFESPFGLFVKFDHRKGRHPNRIVPTNDATDVIGITTVQSVDTSDNPDKWKYAYLCNEVGDKYLQKETLAVGTKQYDQFNEISYIKTSPYEHFIQVPTQNYRPDVEYVPRTKRKEWVRVNLLGKVIVRDDGTCEAGQYCQPYIGKEKKKYGTATISDDSLGWKFYVTQRITENTIEILNSPMTNILNKNTDESN
jgi:trimeric autotransporter adhesin